MDIDSSSAKDSANTIKRKKILLVLDNLESDWAKELINQTDSSIKYHLLTFGISPEQAFLKYDNFLPNLRQKVVIVDTNELSLIAEKEAREYYLELIKDLPKQRLFSKYSIFDILSYKDRNLWWYLNISEKSIWTDKTIHRLYALLRLHYACKKEKYDEARFYVNDPVLQSALIECVEKKNIRCRILKTEPKYIYKRVKASFPLMLFIPLYLIQLCRTLFTLLVKLSILRLAGVKLKNNILPGSTGFFSIYPLWWENAFSEQANDIFFQAIPGEIAKRNKVQQIILLEPWRILLKKRKELSVFLNKGDITVLEKMLGVGDILRLFDPNILIKFFRILSLSRHTCAKIKGVDIADFIREELFNSFTMSSFFQCLLLDKSIKKLHMENLEALFLRLEFQPLERAILYNTAGKTKSFGLQHSALSRNFLNYVFCDGELKDHWNNRYDSTAMPLPDHILTSGSRALECLANAGYPRNRLAICGGIRFGELFAYLKEKRPKQELRIKHSLPLEKKIIFVPTSQMINETICMLSDLLESANASNESLHIIVKGNPNKIHDPRFMSEIIRTLDKGGDKISYEIFDEKIALYDYISMSDCVLLTGGSVALEAMVLGAVPVIYVCPPQFSHNAMTDYPKAVILVDNSESMGRAMKCISNEDVTNRFKENWGKPIYDMFGDISEEPSKKFLNVLREKFVIIKEPGARIEASPP